MRTLICRHCGKEVGSNKKLKHLIQHYCGEKACQAVRKLSFERNKYKTNTLYRSHKLQSARDRKKRRAEQGDPLSCSRYQRDYRASHPAYVAENRQKQRGRNARVLRQSHSWVCRRLSLIEKLRPEVQDALRMGEIMVSHGRELLRLQVNILGGVLQSEHTAQLADEQKAIVLPPLDELVAPMGRLTEMIHKTLQSYER